jgi:hypothetical protein
MYLSVLGGLAAVAPTIRVVIAQKKDMELKTYNISMDDLQWKHKIDDTCQMRGGTPTSMLALPTNV